jgi:GntR family transcriptional regulator
MTEPLEAVPKFIQLANLIAEQIKRGELVPGQPLPSETTLQQRHEVSRGTVRAAMRELRERGLVYTVQAHGTYVVDRS